jgi:sulfite exporter TauE/SafE
MLSLIATSLFLGAAHAFEPDHLAAVGSLAVEKSSCRKIALRGAFWGMGHTLTLFLISMAVIGLGMTLDSGTEALLETAVGIMLVLLGLQILCQLSGLSLHRHAHEHDNGSLHRHAHFHIKSKEDHSADVHKLSHFCLIDWKPLAVGMVHGAAGSGALIVIVASITREALGSGFYILLFGLGSTAGMAAASVVASWPLSKLTDRAAIWLNAVRFAASGLALYLGVTIVAANGTLI